MNSIDPTSNKDTSSQEITNDAERSVKKGIRASNRCFTILVSPPPNLPIDQRCDSCNFNSPRSYSASEDLLQHSSGDISKHLVARQHTGTTEDLLSPDDLSTNIPLEHTVSRLPSIEDLITDPGLRQMFDTSPTHREVQDLIATRDDKIKYENILGLVELSFKNAVWRNDASNDKGLIDTLVLLCRQRLSVIQDPYAVPAGDFARHSFVGNKQTASKIYHRNNTAKSIAGTAPPSSEFIDCSDEEAIVRATSNVAIISVTIKLLRNLCVESQECQEYLHEHRLVDLLFDHIDAIMDVIYLAQNHEIIIASDIYSDTLQWSVAESKDFPRALLQFVINVSSASKVVKINIFNHIFPELFFHLCLSNGNFNLLFCLLNSLICKCPTEKLIARISTDLGYMNLFLLLGSATETLFKEGKLLRITNDTDDPSEWGVIFFCKFVKSCLLQRQSFIRSAFKNLFSVNTSKYLELLEVHLLKAASLGLQSVVSSKVQSIIPSYTDWLTYSKLRVSSLINLPKQLIISVFFSFVNAALELCMEIYGDKKFRLSKEIENSNSFEYFLNRADNVDTQSLGTTESDDDTCGSEGKDSCRDKSLYKTFPLEHNNDTLLKTIQDKSDASDHYKKIRRARDSASKQCMLPKKKHADVPKKADIPASASKKTDMEQHAFSTYNDKDDNLKLYRRNLALSQIIDSFDTIDILKNEFIKCLRVHEFNNQNDFHYDILEPFSACLVTITCFASNMIGSDFKTSQFGYPVVKAIFSLLKKKPQNTPLSNLFLILANLIHKEPSYNPILKSYNGVQVLMEYNSINNNDLIQREASIFALRSICDVLNINKESMKTSKSSYKKV